MSVIAALREATRDLHALVDAESGLSSPSIERYARHLATLRAWLRDMAGWLGTRELDARIERIDADLDAMHARGEPLPPLSPIRASSPVDGAREDESSHGADYRQGVRYVVEGAQLGRAAVGRVMAAFEVPRAYLDHRDPNAWPRFLAQLERDVHGPAATARCVAGAVASFGRYRAIAQA